MGRGATAEVGNAVLPIPLNALAEPARGGYRRYLGWTVGQFPLPRDWERARSVLATAPRDSEEELLLRVLDAYQLNPSDVAALLEAGK